MTPPTCLLTATHCTVAQASVCVYAGTHTWNKLINLNVLINQLINFGRSSYWLHPMEFSTCDIMSVLTLILEDLGFVILDKGCLISHLNAWRPFFMLITKC